MPCFSNSLDINCTPFSLIIFVPNFSHLNFKPRQSYFCSHWCTTAILVKVPLLLNSSLYFMFLEYFTFLFFKVLFSFWNPELYFYLSESPSSISKPNPSSYSSFNLLPSYTSFWLIPTQPALIWFFTLLSASLYISNESPNPVNLTSKMSLQSSLSQILFNSDAHCLLLG